MPMHLLNDDHIEIVPILTYIRFPKMSTLELVLIFKGNDGGFFRESVESWLGYRYLSSLII